MIHDTIKDLKYHKNKKMDKDFKKAWKDSYSILNNKIKPSFLAIGIQMPLLELIKMIYSETIFGQS